LSLVHIFKSLINDFDYSYNDLFSSPSGVLSAKRRRMFPIIRPPGDRRYYCIYMLNSYALPPRPSSSLPPAAPPSPHRFVCS